jgi:hypothetical protein
MENLLWHHHVKYLAIDLMLWNKKLFYQANIQVFYYTNIKINDQLGTFQVYGELYQRQHQKKKVIFTV